MRVVIATDSLGLLSSAEAGAAMASGWARAAVQATVRVVPMGQDGAGLAAAVGASLGAEPQLVATGEVVGAVVTAPGTVFVTAGSDLSPSAGPAGQPELDPAVRSAALARLLADALAGDPAGAAGGDVVLDLSGQHASDAGAGFLAALAAAGPGQAADAGETGEVGEAGEVGDVVVRLDAARAALAGRRLIGLVPAEEVDLPLLGLRGITARAGRESGMDPELMLATDAALERFAVGLVPEVARRDGAGAAGGLGFAVLALGGELTTGPAYCARIGGLAEHLGQADLAVTGCASYDFAHRGGGVLAEVARQAEAALLPCVVLAGEVLIGAREMRTMGVEAAYPVRDADPGSGQRPPTADELTALAVRVARSWSW